MMGKRWVALLTAAALITLTGFSLQGEAAPQADTLTANGSATVETTTVHFAPIPEAQLQAYADTAEPYDKAGAYAIQGRAAVWCSGIEGCYYNIMGLPVHRTAQLMAAFGLQL